MTTEQMAEVSPEQTFSPAEQPEAVAAEQEQAVAEAVQRAVADLTTPEGIRAAAREHPAFEAVFADERNRERQRLEREMRLNEGNLERAQGTVRWAIDQINAGGDPDEIAKQMAPHVKANHDWARVDILKGMIAQARTLDEEAVAPLSELADSLGGNADEVEKVAAAALQAVSGARERAAIQKILDTDDFDSLPESKLKQSIAARIAREAEAEVNARQVESNRPPLIPSAPAGTAAEPMTPARFNAMPREERLAYAQQEAAAGRSIWHLAVPE
jgi:hypothetical protein